MAPQPPRIVANSSSQPGAGTRVNDVHAQLNDTVVADVVGVDSLEAIRAAILRAQAEGLPIAVSGGRHAMGGQQFCSGGLLLDTRPLARVLAFDRERGIIVPPGHRRLRAVRDRLPVRLRLAPRRLLERVVEIAHIDGLIQAFDERIDSGFLYGDFQFAIDPNDASFLRRGVFSCYRPVDGTCSVTAGQRELRRDDWMTLVYLAHVDKARAWDLYSTHYLATSGQRYHSDAHQFGEYVDDYHRWLDGRTRATEPATEMITELFVPRNRLADFMSDAAAYFRGSDVDVIYGTIRLIERDDVTFLPWARERWGCVIFNLHTVHTPAGLEHATAAFQNLIDMAISRGGSYFLTYHRWARPDQVTACDPQFGDFLAAKRRLDPNRRFESDWYRHYAALFA